MAPFDDHGLEGVPPLLVVIEDHDFMLLRLSHDFLFLTADDHRQSQTFLPADSRDFASLARDKPAGKKHVNRFAINNIFVPV